MIRHLSVSVALLCGCAPAFVQATEVWTGPRINFSKSAGADPLLPENQDRITSNVWLTRGDVAGLFNARSESAYVFNHSPDDTEWAYGTTADIGSLTFEDWRTAVNGDPPASVDLDMVLHLISEDIYIDIKFLTWGKEPSSGGFFSYERSTPIPEPGSAELLLLGLTIARSMYRRSRQRSGGSILAR